MIISMLSQIARGPLVSISSSRYPKFMFTSSRKFFKKKNTKEEKPKEKQFICTRKDGPITLIGINRREVRNAINPEAATELCEEIGKFESDTTSPVGILYGMGESFCSGYDINDLEGEPVSTDFLMQAEGAVGPTRRHLKKPMVCAINGYCVANGLELALLCDLRVMEEDAILGFFNRRIGVPVVDGGTIRLPTMIGISRALDLILTGRKVTAKEALEYGIANRIVGSGKALEQAMTLAQSIAKFPLSALNHDRSTLYANVYDAFHFDMAMQNEILYTSREILEDMKVGIKKYIAGEYRGGKSGGTKEEPKADWEKAEIRKEKTKPSTSPNEGDCKKK